MTTAVSSVAQIQRPLLATAGIGAAASFVLLLGTFGARPAFLFAVGIGMGIALYHSAFGFTAAYRRLILDRDISGIVAQLLMLAAAMVLFAPILARGEVFGSGVVGAVAPVGVSMVLGAFMFGVGMQLAGGCGSGTLFGVGGGSIRMIVVLVFFCIGGFRASLDMDWWRRLPEFGEIALGQHFGWWAAVVAQLAVLLGIYLGLRAIGGDIKQALWWERRPSAASLICGPWPLLLGAGVLAVSNWVTLLVAGHPWSITWGFTLWAAKAAVFMGWDPASSAFWSGDFQGSALARPVMADITSVMNFGIILGAFAAATLAGKIAPTIRISARSLAAAVLGGLLLGYGARLAYGCNIGAFFSGVASTSLHGWAWIVAAIAGNMIGVRLRPLFRLLP